MWGSHMTQPLGRCYDIVRGPCKWKMTARSPGPFWRCSTAVWRSSSQLLWDLPSPVWDISASPGSHALSSWPWSVSPSASSGVESFSLDRFHPVASGGMIHLCFKATPYQRVFLLIEDVPQEVHSPSHDDEPDRNISCLKVEKFKRCFAVSWDEMRELTDVKRWVVP